MTNLWNDIKKIKKDIATSFKKHLGNWIGAGLFGLLSVVVVSVSIQGKRLYYLPNEFDKKAASDSAQFKQLFNNDQVQVDNDVITGDKLDSVIDLVNDEAEKNEDFREETKKMLSEIRQQLYKK